MPGGRPTDYQPEYATAAAELCLAGATDMELADFFDVHRATLYRWKAAYPEFRDAIKTAKEHADERIERSLYQKACGYDYVEKQAIKVKDVVYDNGKRVRETERIEIVDVERHQPADTTGQIFWLKNRRPKEWREKQEVEHTVPKELADKLWGRVDSKE